MKTMVKIYLLFSLLGIFSAATATPKIAVTTEELRRIVIDLVRAEVRANVAPTPSSMTSEVNQQILEIQGRLEENRRKSDELIRNYQDALSGSESHCSVVNRELQPNGAASSDANETLRDEVSRLSSELTELSEKLGRIQENIVSRGNPTNHISTETSSTVGVGKLTPEEFQEIIRTKPTPAMGNSYNGSSLEQISRQASSRGYSGHYLTVEVVNYLNRSLKNFDLYDPFKSIDSNGPNFIPPNTKEVFAFSEPHASTSFQKAAFSYRIPNKSVRLVSILKLYEGDFFGVEFVEENTSSESYYNRAMRSAESPNPYFSKVEVGDGTFFIVTHGSIQARATVTMVAYHKGSLRIEIIDLNDL